MSKAAPPVPLPDYRFEVSFLNALLEDAWQRRVGGLARAQPGVLGLQARRSAAARVAAKEPVRVTAVSVAAVVLKSQVVVPLVQTFVWCLLLMMARPARNWFVGLGVGTARWITSVRLF